MIVQPSCAPLSARSAPVACPFRALDCKSKHESYRPAAGAQSPQQVDTAQLSFRVRKAKNDEELLDKVQSYLAALLHNGQIVGDHTPMAKVSGGLLVQAMDWLFFGTGPGERFAHEQLSRLESELSTDGRELARKLEKKVRVPVFYYLSKHFGRSDRAERKRKCPSCGKAWLRKEPLHRIFDFQCRRCRLLSNVAFDVRLI